MTWFDRYTIRKDSKSIALLAVFTAMVVVLEIFPIVGVTDLKLVPTVPSFTIDWTGIPIFVVFLGLGIIFSIVTIAVMGVAIGYRNPFGAIFKMSAELLTVVGFIIGYLICKRMNIRGKRSLIIYAVFAMLWRAVGMYIVNLWLLPIFYGLPDTVAVTAATTLLPWNMLQAAINVMGGGILYYLIPENLALQAGLGDGADRASWRVEELPSEEIDGSEGENSVSDEAG